VTTEWVRSSSNTYYGKRRKGGGVTNPRGRISHRDVAKINGDRGDKNKKKKKKRDNIPGGGGRGARGMEGGSWRMRGIREGGEGGGESLGGRKDGVTEWGGWLRRSGGEGRWWCGGGERSR